MNLPPSTRAPERPSFREAPEGPSFREALAFWFKLGWISFGGTAGHIAIMHDYLVDKKQWISNSKFFHALSICMLLPGPEATQLAIYVGSMLHGKKGGVVAGVLFFLPSMVILLALSLVYVTVGSLPFVAALFGGLKPAVIALIVVALVKVGSKSLRGGLHYVVAGAAFVCIFFFDISLPLIIIGAIVIGIFCRRWLPASSPEGSAAADPAPFNWGAFFRLLLVFACLWAAPLVLFCFNGEFSFWSSIILFFTQAALFTIGGSYTVLPYVAQFAVLKFGWLSRSQMVDGFALAETTPGPLIIVVGFVGFMAGYNHFHSSLLLGSLALLVTTYYTFLPCFFYIFAGAPLIDRTHSSKAIGGVLALVAAAVVGVILNLTIFLGRDVIVPHGHFDGFACAWIVVSLGLVWGVRLNVVYLILISLAVGLLRHLTGF